LGRGLAGQLSWSGSLFSDIVDFKCGFVIFHFCNSSYKAPPDNKYLALAAVVSQMALGELGANLFGTITKINNNSICCSFKLDYLLV